MKEAQRAIREFYLEWRGRYVGEGENATVALTPRQLEALVRISEASAKVRLSDKVTIDDARRATKLLEISLRALGTEPETGKIDIDRIEAGTSSIQRSKIHTMLKLIEDLSKEVGKDVPIDDLLEKAAEQGIDKTTATELVSKLKQKGDLYEPKPGFLRAA
jgi:replicative DNA helicase Mcm